MLEERYQVWVSSWRWVYGVRDLPGRGVVCIVFSVQLGDYVPGSQMGVKQRILFKPNRPL